MAYIDSSPAHVHPIESSHVEGGRMGNGWYVVVGVSGSGSLQRVNVGPLEK
jgi:hypothetical protein